MPRMKILQKIKAATSKYSNTRSLSMIAKLVMSA